MLYWLRGEKLLAVVHFIYFLRILQKLSNILLPSRQNWTTEVCFFLQKEDNSWKYLSQLLLTSYFILVCLNENYWWLLILFLHDMIVFYTRDLSRGYAMTYFWTIICVKILNDILYYSCVKGQIQLTRRFSPTYKH